MVGLRSLFAAPTALLLLGAAGAGFFSDNVSEAVSSAAAQYHAAQASPACNIKGNISIATGERIYHMPGQKYYARTIINTSEGEHWFCSEKEARAAGWRRSRI